VSVESSRPTIPSWREAEVRAALGLPPVEGNRTYSTISTDTRDIPPDALFVALSGERFDGHNYLITAAAAGAAAAIVREGTPDVPALTLFRVADPLRAFGQLAQARRRRLTGPVVAITGTNGKTSTKEMLAAALGTRYVTYATRANLNNLVGVPLTILEAPSDSEALVVEAGANLPGEIARYREIIEPDIVVVTNAVAGHLEGFGSLAGVLEEKLSLTDGVATAIVGTDPPALAAGARSRARRVRTAGLRGADLVPDRVELGSDARPRLTFGGISFTLGARGLHQADNAVRVWAVAEALNLDLAAVGPALEQFVLPGGRGELLQSGGLTILNDSYNANPQSFRSVIATASALRGKRRLVFVAGTMRELGAASADLHREIARELVALQPDLLAAVGEFVPALEQHAGTLGDRLLTAPDPVALGPGLAARLQGDEVVVLKASRGVALERILPALTAVSGTRAGEL
jgi:UDP-N-acetylmuramoyl-tripeptide--D-alanyl-D-alanine ligase